MLSKRNFTCGPSPNQSFLLYLCLNCNTALLDFRIALAEALQFLSRVTIFTTVFLLEFL